MASMASKRFCCENHCASVAIKKGTYSGPGQEYQKIHPDYEQELQKNFTAVSDKDMRAQIYEVFTEIRNWYFPHSKENYAKFSPENEDQTKLNPFREGQMIDYPSGENKHILHVFLFNNLDMKLFDMCYNSNIFHRNCGRTPCITDVYYNQTVMIQRGNGYEPTELKHSLIIEFTKPQVVRNSKISIPVTLPSPSKTSESLALETRNILKKRVGSRGSISKNDHKNTSQGGFFRKFLPF